MAGKNMRERSIGIYVSLDPARPVPVCRWGTRALIAAMRDPSDPRKIHYFPGQVVAISTEEYRRFRGEYKDALKAGDLLRRTEADYQTSLKAEEAEQKKLQAAKAQRKAEEARKASKAPEAKPPEEVAHGPVNTDRTGD